ncbi:hypothetical protein [Pseudomonas putida]|uniref:hypothetical protein n=1 Tax=Pseudomonas putida TaxID=303 RepID=UPI0009535164|nr:hypothetical protein [Pseudomonas putida]
MQQLFRAQEDDPNLAVAMIEQKIKEALAAPEQRAVAQAELERLPADYDPWVKMIMRRRALKAHYSDG